MSRTTNINLNTFYSKLADKSLFYTHQFYIYFEINSAEDPLAVLSDDIDKLVLQVKSSKIPSIDMSEVSVNFLSQKFVLPGGVKYGYQWDVTMVIDNNMDVYKTMLKWQELYASLSRNGGGTHKIPYCKAHVKCLDAAMDTEICDFTLEGIYPTKIPALSMEYENDSKVIEVPFSFIYNNMYNTELGDKNELQR